MNMNRVPAASYTEAGHIRITAPVIDVEIIHHPIEALLLRDSPAVASHM